MQESTSSTRLKISRILTLDYLRGFFLIVIIIDHLWRWPSGFEFISGRGELWASAAEGFVIISGLLVGYIRGARSLELPFKEIVIKVWKRAAVLYLWTLLTTILFIVASWTFTFKAPIAYIPFAPWNWHDMLEDVLDLTFVHSLTHFLYLYAIFLFVTPLAIYGFRRHKAWIVAGISMALFIIGRFTSTEWLQWQVLFFLPATFGFFLESIQAYLHILRPHIRKLIFGAILLITASTMVVSAVLILPSVPGTYHASLFGREPLAPERVLLSFLWVSALAIVFTNFQPWLRKHADWLLRVLGTRSLSAYIIHGLPIMLIALLIPLQTNPWINAGLTLVAIFATWGLLKIPLVAKLIPR